MLVTRLRGSYPATVSRLIVLAAILSSAVVFLSAVQAAPAAAKPVVYDYVVLIDTSRSMTLHQPPLISQVKQAAKGFVDQAPLGSVVYVYAFNTVRTGTETRPGVRLQTPADYVKAKGIIDGLVISKYIGTAIYDALWTSLKELKKVRLASPGKNHVQTILLYTDGRDNESRLSFAQISTLFGLQRAENPLLSIQYVTLGTTAPEEWRNPGIPGVQIVDNPDPSALEPRSVRVQPVLLDFGSLQGTDASKRDVKIEISFDEALQGATLWLAASSKSAESAGGLISIEPKEIQLQGAADSSNALVMQQAVTLRVQNRDSLDQTASYSGQIDLSMDPESRALLSPPSLPFKFTLAAEPRIAIEGSEGDLNGDLGVLDPYADDAKAEATRSITAVFNTSAEAAGSTVTVRLRPKTGTDTGAATLQGADGSATDGVLKLTADQPTCSVVVHVDKGQAAGSYAYELQFVPSGGESLSGLPVDAASGKAVLPLSFTVPAPPPPLSVVVLRWLAVAVVAVLVLAVIAFAALCLITGSGLTVMAGLLIRRLSPKLQDARVEVTAPAQSAQQFELTGKKYFDLVPEQIPTMPFAVRFEAHVAVVSATDEAVVRAHPKSDQSFFTILRATTGIDEVANDSAVATGDAIKFEGTDGERCELVFRSFNYVNA